MKILYVSENMILYVDFVDRYIEIIDFTGRSETNTGKLLDKDLNFELHKRVVDSELSSI